tara:strand:- start:2945 stop:3766 length:822 start_codon:yes stop_codon:yes gene_type:complete
MNNYISKFNGTANDNAFAKVANELCNELSMLLSVRGIEPERTEVSSSDRASSIGFYWDEFGEPIIGNHCLFLNYNEEVEELSLGYEWPLFIDHMGATRSLRPTDWYQTSHEHEMSDAQKLLSSVTIRKWIRNQTHKIPLALLSSPEKLIKRIERELDIYKAFIDTLIPYTNQRIESVDKIKESLKNRDMWMQGFNPEHNHHHTSSWYYHDSLGESVQGFVEVDDGWASSEGKGITKEEMEIRFTFKDGAVSREKYSNIVRQVANIIKKEIKQA